MIKVYLVESFILCTVNFLYFSYLVMLNSYEAIKEVYFNSGSIFMDRNAEGMAKLFGVADSKQ